MIRRPPRSPLFPYTPLFRSLPPLPIPASTPTGLYYFSAYVPAGDADGNNNSAWATQNWNNTTVQVQVSNNPTVLTPTGDWQLDRKSTRLNSSHLVISYAVFC